MSETGPAASAVSVEFHVDQPYSFMWVTWHGQLGGVLKDMKFEPLGDGEYWVDIYSQIAKEVVAHQMRWWLDHPQATR